MRGNQKRYATQYLQDADLVAPNHFWTVVYIDADGIEKTRLAYSYHVLTVAKAAHFFNLPVTRVYNYTGTPEVAKCDHIVSPFWQVHW